MFGINGTPSRKDIADAQRQAEEIKKMLLMNFLVGIATVICTGLTATFSYYIKDLPETIRSLNITVERLTQHVDYQTEKNKQLDNEDQRLERRVERLEDRQ